MEKARKPNIFSCLTITSILFIGIFYVIIAMNSGNWTWFLRNTDLDKPIRIIISDSGEKQTFTAEDEQFQQLAAAVGESVSDLDGTGLIPIGLSDVAIEDYNTKSLIVEVHYARPIKFNTIYRTGSPTKLLIPIQGRNADEKLFFRGVRDVWWFGGMRMASVEPIHNALKELDYLK